MSPGRMFAAACLCSGMAFGADAEFRDIVRAIADEYHTRPIPMPGFGLVNLVTFLARPAGTRHIDLAIFENLQDHGRSGRSLAQEIPRIAGETWKPFVRVRSLRHGREETVLVYMRWEGSACRLLVTTIEPAEAVVVEIKLNPEALARWLDEPRESAAHRYTE